MPPPARGNLPKAEGGHRIIGRVVFIAEDLVYSLINRESGNLTGCVLLELHVSQLDSLDSLI